MLCTYVHSSVQPPIKAEKTRCFRSLVNQLSNSSTTGRHRGSQVTVIEYRVIFQRIIVTITFSRESSSEVIV